MRIAVALAGLALSAGALAGPGQFARRWPVLGHCGGAAEAALTPAQVRCAGAFAVTLDESVYRQISRPDLGDIAAFNADGEVLAFGPMPAQYRPPAGVWRDTAWFALPPRQAEQPADLNLHITRSAAGDLSLDTSLRHATQSSVRDVLIDVRAKDQEVEAIDLELALDAADFSVPVSVDASDDLQSWRNIVPGTVVAQLRHGGQMLVRRHIELPPQPATFLRLRVEDGSASGIPVIAVRLLLRPTAAAAEHLRRSRIAADFVRREGRAYVYRLAARVPVEQLNIALGDDNAIANFSVSAREEGERNWSYVGQLNAFRLRGAGSALDNEAIDVASTRQREWRIEPNIELLRIPTLELAYRPETWLLLTHGKPPFVVAAGSSTARRADFPLDALLAQVRAAYGRGWQPTPATLGAMQTAGGESALSAYDPESRRTWALWAVLLLGAGIIIAMVLRLLREPRPL